VIKAASSGGGGLLDKVIEISNLELVRDLTFIIENLDSG